MFYTDNVATVPFRVLEIRVQPIEITVVLPTELFNLSRLVKGIFIDEIKSIYGIKFKRITISS